MKPDFEAHCAQCGKIVVVKRKKYLDKTRGGLAANFFCNEDCQGAFKKTGAEVSCTYCGKIVYKPKNEIESGANLFCSASCAATFNNFTRTETTKGKTKLLNCADCGTEYIGAVNTPVSTGLCPECKDAPIEKECEICHCKIYGSYAIKYCDPCRSKVVGNKIQSRINNGTLFSKSIRCEYDFNGKKIKCDSKLEYVCLYWFDNNFDVVDMKRSDVIIPYSMDNKTLNYFPDFEVYLSDGTKYLIECKGVVGKKLSDKWHNYNRKAIEKKKVLEKWCEENGYIPFWFSQLEHQKLYYSLKIEDGLIVQ